MASPFIPVTLKEELGVTDEDIDNLTPSEREEFLRLILERMRIAARDELLPFIHFMNPQFCEGQHHRIICEHLEAVERGDIPRFMLHMPPRSSKSFISSIYFPAWYMGRHPRAQILAVSYNIDLVNIFGRGVRGLVSDKEYAKVFPQTKLSPDFRAAASWSTTLGGIYNGAGIKGGIAGKGASLGIIDDPLNEQDAFSAPAIDHVNKWYPGGFRARLMPGGRIVLTQTRWVLDDLSGYLLRLKEQDPAREAWTVLKIPALVDEGSARMLGWTPELGDNAPYAPGTTYWPPAENPPQGAELIGWSTDYLEQTRREMPEEQWLSLYMQEPVPAGGAIFKRDYIQNWDKSDPPSNIEFSMFSIDTAYSQKVRGNFSTITYWGIFKDPKGYTNMLLMGAWRDRWDFAQLKNNIKRLYKIHEPDIVLVEEKTAGPALITELRLANLPMVGYNPGRDDKMSRAHACIPYIYGGRLWFPLQKKWAIDVLQEMLRFQGQGNEVDDYVDTVTQAILWSRGGQLLVAEGDITTEEEWKEAEEEILNRNKRRTKLI